MSDFQEYLDHAAECERLASIASSAASREMLLHLALRWQDLSAVAGPPARQQRRENGEQPQASE
jgi:hypothetical protein